MNHHLCQSQFSCHTTRSTCILHRNMCKASGHTPIRLNCALLPPQKMCWVLTPSNHLRMCLYLELGWRCKWVSSYWHSMGLPNLITGILLRRQVMWRQTHMEKFHTITKVETGAKQLQQTQRFLVPTTKRNSQEGFPYRFQKEQNLLTSWFGASRPQNRCSVVLSNLICGYLLQQL